MSINVVLKYLFLKRYMYIEHWRLRGLSIYALSIFTITGAFVARTAKLSAHALQTDIAFQRHSRASATMRNKR